MPRPQRTDSLCNSTPPAARLAEKSIAAEFVPASQARMGWYAMGWYAGIGLRRGNGSARTLLQLRVTFHAARRLFSAAAAASSSRHSSTTPPSSKSSTSLGSKTWNVTFLRATTKLYRARSRAGQSPAGEPPMSFVVEIVRMS
jgi:hypothetical protein